MIEILDVKHFVLTNEIRALFCDRDGKLFLKDSVVMVAFAQILRKHWEAGRWVEGDPYWAVTNLICDDLGAWEDPSDSDQFVEFICGDGIEEFKKLEANRNESESE